MVNPPISAIVFDLGNVLFDLDIPRTWRALEQLMDVQFEHPFAYPPTKEIMYAYETGDVSTGAFVGELQRLCKPETKPEQIVEAWNAMLLTLPPKRLPFLKALKQKYPLYLLSNINSLHLEFFYKHMREVHDLRNWDTTFFDQTFYSNYIGLRKPDIAVYEHVIDSINHAPESVLFIDDNAHNIKGAQSLGIQTIHLGASEEIVDHSFFKSLNVHGRP